MAEAVKENENYIRIPYEFLSKGFTAAGLLTLGKIFTFSSANVKERICRSSFKTFAKDFRLSERQIARQVKELKAEKIVVQDKSRRACAAYTYAGEKCGNGLFVRSYICIRKNLKFWAEGKRYLDAFGNFSAVPDPDALRQSESGEIYRFNPRHGEAVGNFVVDGAKVP